MASVLPGRRPRKVLAKVEPHRLEEVAVRAEAEQENPEVVLRARLVVGAGVPRARGLRALGAEGDEDRELNRRLDLARVGRAVEEAVLDCALVVPEVVEVQRVVAVALVVVGVRREGSEPRGVDRVHRRVAHRANLVDETVVGLLRVAFDAGGQGSGRLEDQLLLLVEGAHEVLDVLGGEVRRADVDVEPRAAVRLRALAPQGAYHLLEGVEVGDRHHRRDRLGGGSAKAAVADHLPLAPVGHRHLPSPVGAADESRGSAGDLGDRLGRRGLADPLVLELAPEGAVHHLCLCYRHLLFPFVFWFRGAYPRFVFLTV